MIEIKEQGSKDGLGLCVQKVKVSAGIKYPDVSSCITLTSVIGDEFIGVHLGLMDPAKTKGGNDISTVIKNATIYFVKKRIEAFGGKAATNNFVIGWYATWPQGTIEKIIRGQFEKVWCGDLWEASDSSYQGSTSSDITFLTNGNIEINMKAGASSKGTISLSWKDPKEKKPYFTIGTPKGM